MNYYEHHLGDYAEATAHLSFIEDAAYSRLMRKVYATEAPLPSDIKSVQRLVGARTKEEREAVAVVLEEFFVLEADGWHNERCDIEIAKYQKKALHNREVGKLGGRPRKTETQPDIAEKPKNNPVGLFEEPKHNPPQSPVPSPQLIPSEDKSSGAAPPKLTDPNEIIFGYGLPMLTNAGTGEKQARSFLGGLRKHHGDQALIDKLRDCAKAKPLQPLEWLAAALPPKPTGKHAGFENQNYHEEL